MISWDIIDGLVVCGFMCAVLVVQGVNCVKRYSSSSDTHVCDIRENTPGIFFSRDLQYPSGVLTNEGRVADLRPVITSAGCRVLVRKQPYLAAKPSIRSLRSMLLSLEQENISYIS